MNKEIIKSGVRILLLSISSIALGSLLAVTNRTDAFEIKFTQEEPEEATFLKQYAYISGAVVNPGVYEITEEWRYFELIDKAGGFSEKVDSTFINTEVNLSQKLSDGDHIHIPFEQKTEQIQNTYTNLVSINNANTSQLTSLPGIGESTAAKIIQSRPYNSIEELTQVSGIGDATLDKLRPYITL